MKEVEKHVFSPKIGLTTCYVSAILPFIMISLIRIMQLKFEINKKFTSFETWSTITTTLKFSGLNTSPVLRNGFNKWEMGWFLLVIKTTCKLPVTVYKTIVSVMFQRFWLLLRWQKGRKEAWFRLLLVRIYEKIFAGLKSLNLTLNQLSLKKLPEETWWSVFLGDKSEI